MRRLLIAGAGGHGKVVAETAEAMGTWDTIAFLDDRHAELNGTLRWQVLGGMSGAASLRKEYADIVVAVGHADTRLALLDRFSAEGFNITSVIHPSAWVSPSAQMGEGSAVFASAAINADASIGRGVIINTGATVDHDCHLGDGVHICPGAHLAGDVRLGHGTWIGIGASLVQGVQIGAHAMIGAGAAVIGNIDAHATAVGVPARVVRRDS